MNINVAAFTESEKLSNTLIRLREQSNLGPYCLQYRLLKNISRQEEQITKVVTGGLRVKFVYVMTNFLHGLKFSGLFLNSGF